MTVLGIFGDKDASKKLVTASLNDMLEAHVLDTPDEEFWLCLGMRKPLNVYETIIGWALKNEIYVVANTKFDSPGWQASFDGAEFEVAEWHRSDRFMMDVVERLSAEKSAKIFALLGDEEPAVDVRRALVRALDSGLEVRDLAEAGLTYVGVADNPIRQGSTTMADEQMTLEQAGEAADEGDEEALTELTNLAEQFELDPDEYPTWAALAEALDPLLAAAEEEAPPEQEEEQAPRRSSGGALSEEDLEGKSVPELRQLAKQLGVDGWDKNRSAKLIEGILEAQSGNGEAAPRQSGDTMSGVLEIGGNGISAAALARGLRAFADALEG